MFSEDNKKNYNIWSQFYDSYPNPTVAIDELTFFKFYAGEKGLRALEIGCGTGRHTQRILNAGNTVTAIDNSEGMLEQAKNKITGDVQFVLGDVLTMTVPNAPFDFAVMSLVLEHIPDLTSFFAKIHSLLVPGGRFYFSEIHPARTAGGIMAHFKTEDGDEIHLRSSPHSENEIQVAATNAGFKIEKMETVVGNTELTQANPKWEKHMGQPMIQIWVLIA